MKKFLLALGVVAALSLLFVSCGDKPATDEPDTPAVTAEVFESSSKWAELNLDTTGLKSIKVVFAEAPENLQFKVATDPAQYFPITTAEATCDNPDGNVQIGIQNTAETNTIKIVKATGTKADGTEVTLTVDAANGWGWTKK